MTSDVRLASWRIALMLLAFMSGCGVQKDARIDNPTEKSTPTQPDLVDVTCMCNDAPIIDPVLAGCISTFADQQASIDHTLTGKGISANISSQSMLFDAELENNIYQIMYRNGLSNIPAIVPCNEKSIEGMRATYIPPNSKFSGRSIGEGEYIIYNPNWFIGRMQSPEVLVAFAGHELGHFVNRDFNQESCSPSSDEKCKAQILESESKADYYAGYTLAMMCYPESVIQSLYAPPKGGVYGSGLMRALRSIRSDVYPNPEESMELALSGFRFGNKIRTCHLNIEPGLLPEKFFDSPN